MALNWLKYEFRLPRRPQVMRMSRELSLHHHDICGRLLAVWSWAQEHTEDGTIATATTECVDLVAEQDGFGDAMQKAGWLEVTDDAIAFPKWDEHNSEGAKQRAENARRQANRRGSRNASVTQNRDTCNASVTKERDTCNETALPKEREKGTEKGTETRQGDNTKSASASGRQAVDEAQSSGDATTATSSKASPDLTAEAESLLDDYAQRWNSADLGVKVTIPVASGYRRMVATAWRKTEHRDALRRIDDVFAEIAAKPHLAAESWFVFDWLLKWKQGEAKPNVQKVLDRQLGGGNTNTGRTRDVGAGQLHDPDAPRITAKDMA